MSAPAAKALSLPVITMQPILSSASNCASASPSSSISASLSALSALGRFSVIRPTRPRVSTRMFSYDICVPLSGRKSVNHEGHLTTKDTEAAKEKQIRLGSVRVLCVLRGEKSLFQRLHHAARGGGEQHQVHSGDGQRVALADIGLHALGGGGENAEL